MYSILPWPNGCSLSLALLDSFAPAIVTTFDAASDRLFTASAVIATEFENEPTMNFATQSIILQKIPTAPLSIP